MNRKLHLTFLVISGIVVVCDSKQRKPNENVQFPPFDEKLYEEVLNPEYCRRQTEYIRRNDTLLLAKFLDAGLRIPKGITLGNTIELGNYYQCLGIKENVTDMNIQGKYCMIQMTLNQDQLTQFLSTSQLPERDQSLRLSETILNYLKKQKDMNVFQNSIFGRNINSQRMGSDSQISNTKYSLAVCIPAACTTQEGINALLFNISAIGLEYTENFCRLPNDKLWAPVDYVAIAIFSIIGILTFLSTSYDIYYTWILKSDKRNKNSLYFCCSVYSNTQRLLTFTSGPDSLECIDGIRALAMVWVILGHTFYSLPNNLNPVDALLWSISPNAIWVTSAPMTVDTFFLLSGLLLVYSTAGKLTGEKLIKNIHLFYLNRLLRMFPVLAAMVLFEASLYNRVSDGPLWEGAASYVVRCREYWWSTLLHIQNFVNPQDLCLGVSWYLSLDVQLHILSPIVLFWVLSTRKYHSWVALTFAMLSVLTASTIYIFYMNMPSGIISPNRTEEMTDFFLKYYINILTRASPFCVGMIIGYILHSWRGKKPKISTVLLLLVWCATFLLLGAIIYCTNISMQFDWDNQLADNIFNSYLRPLWALALAWIIFACVKGFGGPINWFLSLQVWKLPARLSYAMYIIHYSVMVAYYYSAVTPIYFTLSALMFNFFAFFFLTFLLAFAVTVVIDAPFSILIKMLLSKGTKKSANIPDKKKSIENGIAPAEVKVSSINPAFISDEDKSTSVLR
ncbi:unnamed protein product [Parnassius mnemosyne]|uniref:Nose resistant-to-fluoxetine protein N-terminal domain-containing protein n=1 Tax=Parnassius mnemosyne TaxID=213953 RepID=A0AAV1LZ43_9NEOP